MLRKIVVTAGLALALAAPGVAEAGLIKDLRAGLGRTLTVVASKLPTSQCTRVDYQPFGGSTTCRAWPDSTTNLECESTSSGSGSGLVHQAWDICRLDAGGTPVVECRHETDKVFDETTDLEQCGVAVSTTTLTCEAYDRQGNTPVTRNQCVLVLAGGTPLVIPLGGL